MLGELWFAVFPDQASPIGTYPLSESAQAQRRTFPEPIGDRHPKPANIGDTVLRDEAARTEESGHEENVDLVPRIHQDIRGVSGTQPVATLCPHHHVNPKDLIPSD